MLSDAVDGLSRALKCFSFVMEKLQLMLHEHLNYTAFSSNNCMIEIHVELRFIHIAGMIALLELCIREVKHSFLTVTVVKYFIRKIGISNIFQD